MSALDDFAKDKSGPQLTMLVATALLFVSQFFLYLNDASSGMLTGTSDYEHATVLHIFQFESVGTGWQLHPQIWIVLPVLLVCFLYKPIVTAPVFRQFGYWAGLALVFWGFTPGAPFREALGAQIGGVAVLIALVAAIRNQFERRTAVAATPVAHDKH